MLKPSIEWVSTFSVIQGGVGDTGYGMWDIGVKNEWDTGYEGQKNRDMGYQKNRGMWDMGFIPMPKKLVPTFFYHIFSKNMSRMV